MPGRSGTTGAMNAGLSGTGRVADDLYLMAHHEVTGKPFVQPRALGTGLAGALLAELMLGTSISLRPDGAVLPGRTWPGDELAHHVRDLIAAEREPHLVRDWLLFLARTAANDVAGRLERSGYVRRAGGRVRWRAGRWVPVDPDWAFSPLVRVRSALDPARPLPAHGAVLAGLAAACGLSFRLAQHVPPPARHLDEALAQLNPHLQELIAQTQAVVGSAVLSHRT
jgi:Golgi phosphoprotein 3 (GPP34)